MICAVVLCVALHLPLIHCLLCEYPSVVACYCVATEALAAGPMCINSTGVGSRVERGFGSAYDCNGHTSYKCDSFGDRGWCCVELMKLSTVETSSGGPQATTVRTTTRTTKHSITMIDSSSASLQQNASTATTVGTSTATTAFVLLSDTEVVAIAAAVVGVSLVAVVIGVLAWFFRHTRKAATEQTATTQAPVQMESPHSSAAEPEPSNASREYDSPFKLLP
jgi:hypothetical protein